MARWVADAGGPPTIDPYKTTFANLAASMGTTPAALATLIQTFDVAPANLLVALNTLSGATVAPGATAQTLATALAAFEAAITAEVAALNTALTTAGIATQITAPAAITIPGIDA